MEQYPITPVSKPRMTRKVKWDRNAHQTKYFAFKNEVQRLGVEVPEFGYHLVFVIPMPKSWSKKKKALMDGSPHRNDKGPDKDNLEKALLDSVYSNDARVWNGEVSKVWGIEGSIVVADNRREFDKLAAMFPKAFDELIYTGVLIA